MTDLFSSHGEGGVEPLLKGVDGFENGRQEEVEQGPEFWEVVLGGEKGEREGRGGEGPGEERRKVRGRGEDEREEEGRRRGERGGEGERREERGRKKTQKVNKDAFRRLLFFRTCARKAGVRGYCSPAVVFQ